MRLRGSDKSAMIEASQTVSSSRSARIRSGLLTDFDFRHGLMQEIDLRPIVIDDFPFDQSVQPKTNASVPIEALD